jgi:hypothetical protein
MTDRVIVTAAEVAYLVAVADPSLRSVAPAMLGISAEELTDAVRAAGLASLVVRDLAVVEGENVRLTAPVAAVAEGLTRATTIIQVGLVAPDNADGALLFDTGQVRLLVGPRPYRRFEIIALDVRRDLREPLTHIVRTFLAEHCPGVASLRLEHGPVDQIGHLLSTTQVDPTSGFGWVTVAVGSDGVWSYADASDQTVRKGVEAEALARFADVVGSLLALPASR